MDSHRARILKQLLLYLDAVREFNVQDLIARVEDEAYASTAGEKHCGERFHYHIAISFIANHFDSKRKPGKAVAYLQRELNVIRDEELLFAVRQRLTHDRRGVFGWKYIGSS